MTTKLSKFKIRYPLHIFMIYNNNNQIVYQFSEGDTINEVGRFIRFRGGELGRIGRE